MPGDLLSRSLIAQSRRICVTNGLGSRHLTDAGLPTGMNHDKREEM